MTKFLDKKMTFGPPKGGQWPSDWLDGISYVQHKPGDASWEGLERHERTDEIEQLIKANEESMNERE